MQKYSVNQQIIETALAWVKADDVAIPDIQRPFVLDSFGHGIVELLGILAIKRKLMMGKNFESSMKKMCEY